MGTLRTRPASVSDAASIATIYNQGIEDRVATFETRPRTAGDIASWFGGRYPVVVVEWVDSTDPDDAGRPGATVGVGPGGTGDVSGQGTSHSPDAPQGEAGAGEPGAVAAPGARGTVVAFAATSGYRPRDCYAGIAEFSVYVERGSRGRGAGRLAMAALVEAAAAAGFHKLVSRVFVENGASRALLRSVGFREVGTYERHARLDGRWRDVVIVERLLADPSGEPGPIG